MMQAQPFKIYAIINVSQPVLQQGLNDRATPYVTYLISGKDPHGEFGIRRRFRQFYQLRKKLVQRFVGIYIPPIPSKKASGNTEERFVQQRRRFLNYFCLKIADRPFLFDCDIFQTFLRGDPDFQRAARYISGHEFALIANIYDVEFRQMAEQLNINRVIKELESENQTLKLIEKKLTEIREQIESIVQIKRMFINQYSRCYTLILPKFEQQFLSKHGIEKDQLIFLGNQSFKQRMNEYCHFSSINPLLDYIQSITYDIREVRALIQAIETRKIFKDKKNSFETACRQSKQELQKLQNGRMSIKSLFTSGSKEVQIKELENYIPRYQRNEAFLQMCLPLSAVSIRRDIQLFKKSRTIDYLGTLQIIAQKQMRILDLYRKMLTAVQVQPTSNYMQLVCQKQADKSH